MSGINEWIVKEYFEILGYMVIQPRKYVVPGKQKTAEEEVDLLIINPRVSEQRLPEHLVWTTDDLKSVARAVVGVRGGHTGTFYGSTFEQTPDILRFTEPASLHFAERYLGPGPLAKILCLPKLPGSGEIKEKSVKVLKKKGVDGVVAFETILAELVARVDKNRNYEKSDLLQIIRILKNYDFLKDSQMDLFLHKRRRRAARGPEKDEGPVVA